MNSRKLSIKLPLCDSKYFAFYDSNTGAFEDKRVDVTEIGKTQIGQNTDTHHYDVSSNAKIAAPLQVKL